MRVALVNTNRIQPAIAPIGVDYVAEALAAAGHEAELLDLCWEPDPRAAIEQFFRRGDFPLAGVTLRNTDDCGFTTRHSFLPEFAGFVQHIRESCGGVLVIGGVGFSTMPETVLNVAAADAGVWADGEFAFPELAARLERKEPWRDLPNLIWRDGGSWRRNPPFFAPLAALPLMTRSRVDNLRYFALGGQGGFETKRGCPGQCVYCADPAAKGSAARTRPPSAVADELTCLLRQGIDTLHACDGEFNLPEWHAREVAMELSRRGLGGRLRWYAYCSPAPFSSGLADVLGRAGCVGINFGTDHGDAGMLRRLGRGFGPEDIVNAVCWAKRAGITVMLDLLLGSPGESRESLVRTVELMKRADPDRVGVSVGVRVYPGTRLAARLEAAGPLPGLSGGSGPADPLFFLEPRVAPFVFSLLDSLIAGDPRFLFFDPAKQERNYNYHANHRLVEAIAAGQRGAYWDILLRLDENA